MAAPPHPLDLTPAKLLYGIAFAWHFGWASSVPTPSDWDPAYALEVARHIAQGEGAVTDAVWNLGFLPESLRHPADLHWMPLPSRLLVPFVAMAQPGSEWPAAQLCSVIVAAAWAPLGWSWAKRLGATDNLAWAAGFVCASAGGYARTITTPDSIGLYGLLGGLALLAASNRNAMALPLAALAALTRGDGFLLGLACMVAWKGAEGAAVGLAGLGALTAWSLRCYLLVGEGWIALRERAANSTTLQQIITPLAPVPPTIAERLSFFVGELGTIGAVWLLITVGVLGWTALLELYRRRADRGLWPIPLYALGFPPVIHLLAPAISAEGSVYRSSAALLVPVVALAILGASKLTHRYHPAFLPWMLAGAAITGSGLMAQTYSRVLTPLDEDCAALIAAGVPSGASVISYDPIGVSARCGHPGIIMAQGATVEPLVERYQIEWALVAPPHYDNGTVQADDFAIAGFSAVSGRVYRRD